MLVYRSRLSPEWLGKLSTLQGLVELQDYHAFVLMGKCTGFRAVWDGDLFKHALYSILLSFS